MSTLHQLKTLNILKIFGVLLELCPSIKIAVVFVLVADVPPDITRKSKEEYFSSKNKRIDTKITRNNIYIQ